MNKGRILRKKMFEQIRISRKLLIELKNNVYPSECPNALNLQRVQPINVINEVIIK